ncbi:hypothetical protein COU36_01090 [Candidatus Micrarchaeota archaeon CG10_big_fil_rev_8_21_14_0_10_59_7]|nr:MAG: hypothetical protein COU36_01090 [Candidatus Micrarchaeota archaeon CG10_big_fil_rev_8_21_14_0_10_59_7]
MPLKSLVSLEDFRNTYPGCAYAPSLKKVGHLLPLSMDHRLFPHVNRLVAFTLFSGYIEKGYRPYLSEKPEMLAKTERLFGGVFEDADYEPRTIYRGKGGQLRPKESGRPFGRILSVLGVPVGKPKSRAQLELPPYIMDAVKRAKTDPLAMQTLRDFSAVMLKLRLRTRQPPRTTAAGVEKRSPFHLLELPESTNKKSAEKFARQVLKLLKTVSKREMTLHVRPYRNRWMAVIRFVDPLSRSADGRYVSSR